MRQDSERFVFKRLVPVEGGFEPLSQFPLHAVWQGAPEVFERSKGEIHRARISIAARVQADELIDWIDGALLVDLWEDLRIPQVIRRTWDPVVEVAGDGPIERPWYGPPAGSE